MYLYHYFDKSIGPFKNLSDVSIEEANRILNTIKITKPDTLCAKRSENYMELRKHYELILRQEFEKKNGLIKRKSPHYMVIGESKWLSTWFDNGSYIKIDIEEFDKRTISFTYGDSHPTFSDRVNDGKEYRKKLYNYEEILQIIEKYGYPQEWNNDGKYGPERYIEAHIWSDDIVNKYL